ncbi:uncharacterized protein NECHADRAFT_88807 [Fusarium vanettenii 77-13-4]|uniref:Uncharacterized protein n=1 Tax=Fusarium vanettenii (strain ATCC MYA-4622 / CBS 123669 / FGSC 9596 / NRRL 45880 / 77-13-4) TaxID=660122 RepID=C7ZKG9_FUSV7|nr:uncharacterized protein NECHADRAFT_88807 [Fusarium vanettenii 77-13-4]EEU35519.1 hypothetical protein NECHADRAFT_88807 [Fusarium vanettenii 77-13-4]
MLAVAISAIGALVAVMIGVSWLRPTTDVIEPLMQPWIETGWPIKNVEPWRVRVCHVHWKLLQRAPFSTPGPLHEALNLDATSEPFYPQSFSSSPDKEWHHRVLMAVLKATAQHAGADLDWTARHLPSHYTALKPGNDWETENENMLTLMEIGSLLSNDHVRGHYAQWFVPALTRNKPKDDEKRRESRIDALKDLCA